MADEMDSPSIADDMSLPDAPSPQPDDDDMLDEDEQHHVVLSRSARFGPTDAEARELAAHGKKSFKRKYAKEKIKYELAMRDCNELFKEEAQIRDLSKRLREQNDQLLELLADLNNTCHVDAYQRYNLDLPIDEGPALDDLYNLPQEISRFHADLGSSKSVAEDTLRRCKEDLHAQRITPAACREIERDILRGDLYRPRRFFSALRERLRGNIPDYPPKNRPAPDPKDVGFNLGFLSSEQEAAYLGLLDKGQCRLLEGPQSEVEREREAAIRNPMSVFNWFRNDPTWTPPTAVSKEWKGNDSTSAKESTSKGKERDTESASIVSEKASAPNPAPTVASRTPAARASKSRASLQAAAAAARQADEYFNEDQDQPVAPPAPSRSKRKRDDDAGYRPKGGSGSQSSRRRRKDGGRRTSRRSTNAAAASEAKRGESGGSARVQGSDFDVSSMP